MIFLPIVVRELRVAARRKSTHRIRLWTTVAGLIAGLFLLVPSMLLSFGTRNGGQVLFYGLAFYIFGLALLAGIFLAGDCISEEKREGTLGLLFLTDLKGYDVVLGKLMAVGLNALYGLVAMLPVLGLSLLMGGITGAEYWRVSLGLVNLLFFALATGIVVSTWYREATRAMGVTAGMLMIAVVGLPVLGNLLPLLRLPAEMWYFTCISPFHPISFALSAINGGLTGKYWISLLASHFFAWLLLLIAGWALPRVWQDQPTRAPAVAVITSSEGNPVPQSNSATQPTVQRRLLLDTNPIVWLALNKRTQKWRHRWLFVPVMIVALPFLVEHVMWGPTLAVMLTNLFGWILKILMAVQAARFFSEARKSGALELILSTPLTSREMIEGQWQALKRRFLWPGIVFLVLLLITTAFQQFATTRTFSKIQVKGTTSATTFLNNGWSQFTFLVLPMLLSLYQVVRWVFDMLTIGWMGMWFGLSARKPSMSVALTILFVIIIPAALVCIPNIAIDIGFILWARTKLYGGFRRAALPQYSTSYGPPVPPPNVSASRVP